VELWQEFSSVLGALTWWQTALLFASVIIAALLAAVLVAYLYFRFVRKMRLSFFYIFTLVFSNKPIRSGPARTENKHPAEKRELHAPELLGELNRNLETAKSFAEGKIARFETAAWEDNRSVLTAPHETVELLRNIYSDINVVNELIRISESMGSSYLSDSYTRRIPLIIDNLKRLLAAVDMPGENMQLSGSREDSKA